MTANFWFQFFYPKHQCDNNYGPDDDKENIKHEDPESLQQQLDEVLRACADYEERHRGRQQVPSAESPGNVSSGSAASTPPQQNRWVFLMFWRIDKILGLVVRRTCHKTGFMSIRKRLSLAHRFDHRRYKGIFLKGKG